MTDNEKPKTIADVIPKNLIGILKHRDGAAKLLKRLPRRYDPQAVAKTTLKEGPGSPHNVWESCGCIYKDNERYHEAIAILESLYEHLLLYQVNSGKRTHKGAPLVWLSECHAALDRPVIARRYLMLTACEDAILHKGQIKSVVDGGFYFRAAWKHGLPHALLERYLTEIWSLRKKFPKQTRFPEWIIQHLDQEWMTVYPTPSETGEYRISKGYIVRLMGMLGDGTGNIMEILAHYVLSAIPGCRVHRRQGTHSTDLDVAGAFEGPVQDFRSDIGRYFVCECKDWKKPADVTAFAKFSRILDSTKCRFGILFSSDGISGEGQTKYAEREQLKLFQDRGIVIVVVDEDDLQAVAEGANFITMLRRKYEKVRLDLKN
jgi:hypothetical protein